MKKCGGTWESLQPDVYIPADVCVVNICNIWRFRFSHMVPFTHDMRSPHEPPWMSSPQVMLSSRLRMVSPSDGVVGWSGRCGIWYR